MSDAPCKVPGCDHALWPIAGSACTALCPEHHLLLLDDIDAFLRLFEENPHRVFLDKMTRARLTAAGSVVTFPTGTHRDA